MSFMSQMDLDINDDMCACWGIVANVPVGGTYRHNGGVFLLYCFSMVFIGLNVLLFSAHAKLKHEYDAMVSKYLQLKRDYEGDDDDDEEEDVEEEVEEEVEEKVDSEAKEGEAREVEKEAKDGETKTKEPSATAATEVTVTIANDSSSDGVIVQADVDVQANQPTTEKDKTE